MNDFEICLEDLEQLGSFVEIEKAVVGQEETGPAKEELGLLEKVALESEITNKKYEDLMQEILNKK